MATGDTDGSVPAPRRCGPMAALAAPRGTAPRSSSPTPPRPFPGLPGPAAPRWLLPGVTARGARRPPRRLGLSAAAAAPLSPAPGGAARSRLCRPTASAAPLPPYLNGSAGTQGRRRGDQSTGAGITGTPHAAASTPQRSRSFAPHRKAPPERARQRGGGKSPAQSSRTAPPLRTGEGRTQSKNQTFQ